MRHTMRTVGSGRKAGQGADRTAGMSEMAGRSAGRMAGSTGLSIEQLTTFCKEKGFVFQSGELYGGIAGFWDFGPMGVELKNNIKESLWKSFVRSREDIVGIDGAIITNPKVWKASGHVDSFADLMIVCEKEKKRYRAVQFLEEQLGIDAAGFDSEAVNEHIKKHSLVCPSCRGPLKRVDSFNIMFTTEVGAGEQSTTSYLRPETAQLIFPNFRFVMDTARKKLPFGIAQLGKAFRNEISPRDFLFRTREFEQFEIEFFTNPSDLDASAANDFSRLALLKVQFLGAEEQEKKSSEHRRTTIRELADKKLFASTWHAVWIGLFYEWFLEHGIRPEHLRIREHRQHELAHYASSCFDIEYKFPFGWNEIHGSANRSDFDLAQHSRHSGRQLSVYDEERKKSVLPVVVAEPSQGIERAMLAFLFDAYSYDAKRGNIVLSLDKRLAPVSVAVFPLVNRLSKQARQLFDTLRKDFSCMYDQSGSVGRRYARADEVGIPYCITLDFESLDDRKVTVRDIRTTKQDRVKISELTEYLKKGLS